MNKDIRLTMVKDAEFYLAAAKAYLEDLEIKVKECVDLVERKKLVNSLEQDRIRFSQMMADTVIFKAKHGIFTDPPEYSKRVK